MCRYIKIVQFKIAILAIHNRMLNRFIFAIHRIGNFLRNIDKENSVLPYEQIQLADFRSILLYFRNLS